MPDNRNELSVKPKMYMPENIMQHIENNIKNMLLKGDDYGNKEKQ